MRLNPCLLWLCAALPLAAGCGSAPKSLVTTIDDLASDTDREGRFRIDQNRIVSLTGTLSPSAPGQAMRFKSNRATSTMFGLTPGDSYNDVLTVEPPDKPDLVALVASVKDALRAAQLAGVELVSTRLRVSKLEGDLEDAREAGEEDRVAELQSDLDSALSAYDEARDDLDTKTTTASEAINQPGLVVFRWATEEESSFSLSALFGFSSSQEATSSGYTIAAGWRESTLVLGPDVLDIEVAPGKSVDWWVMYWGWLPGPFSLRADKYRRLTTRTIQSKAIAYLQDVSVAKSLEANLEATVDQLSSSAKALEAIDKVELQVALARVQSLSTEGLFGNAKRDVEADALAAFKKDAATGSYPDPVKTGNGWLTLLAVDAKLIELQEMF